jgi:branched-chain amino acid transport system substrate-binding protein
MVTKRIRRRAIAAGVAVGMVGLAITGCGSAAKSPSASAGTAASSSDSPYLIGMTDDLSGPLAAYGKWAQQAWTAYFNGINAAGGINGHKIKLTILDDASVASQAINNVRQLISQGAILVTGSTQSNMCAAVAPIATQDKVPIMCTATTQGLAQGYVFGRIMPGPTAAAPTLQLIQTLDPSAKSVAIMHTDSADTVQFGAALQSLVTSKGLTASSNTTLPSSATADVSGPAASILSKKPNVIGSDMIPPLAVSMVHSLRADGSSIPLVLAVSDYPSLISLQDPNYYQLWGHAVVNPDSTEPAVKTLVKDLATVGVTGIANINDGRLLDDYLAAVAIAQALKTCGQTCTRAGLTTALSHTELNLPGITEGEWGYTPSRHLPITAYTAYKYDPTTKQVVVAQANLAVGS